MLTAAGSPLVAGSGQATMDKPPVRIVVERSFLYQGKSQAKGAILDVPPALASELVWMGKATKYVPPPKPTPKAAPKAASDTEGETK
jgi:hypothetical protein